MRNFKDNLHRIMSIYRRRHRDWNIPLEAFLSIIRGQVLNLEFHVSSRQTFNGIGLLDLVP